MLLALRPWFGAFSQTSLLKRSGQHLTLPLKTLACPDGTLTSAMVSFGRTWQWIALTVVNARAHRPPRFPLLWVNVR